MQHVLEATRSEPSGLCLTAAEGVQCLYEAHFECELKEGYGLEGYGRRILGRD